MILLILVLQFCVASKVIYANANETFSVALIGDSLINRACNDFDLIGKLKANLEDYDVEFTNYGQNGARIQAINDNLPFVLSAKPGVV